LGRRKRKGATTASAVRRKARKRKEQIAVREKKKFLYKGYSIEELKELSFDQLLEIFPSRIRRSLNRGYNIENKKLHEKIECSPSDAHLRTHVRDHVILPKYVGRTIGVYNGREFFDVEIKPEMIGHYLGEFSMTRKVVKHSGPGVGATRSSKFMPKK